MSQFTLVYFKGCPNHLPAVELLEIVGIEFEVVCQDELGSEDPMKSYSSPTLLRGQEVIFGAKAIGGGCSMPLPSKEELIKRIETNHAKC